MKNLVHILIVVLFASQGIIAQDITTVEAKSIDISDNLDLEAVASVFGESENLEDFERRLNNPELKISNLDLNEDGFVDYLRVVENAEENTILITIQAILGENYYQDVATIDVEKDNRGRTYVQVVGDVYMYGPDYIIEPVYVYSPPVVIYLWGPTYHRWYSPYYWHYYPSYYHAWHPYSCHIYRNRVHVHVNINHRYYYPKVRRSTTAVHIHSRTGRKDFARTHPNRSFSSRNTGVRNKQELNTRRGTSLRASGANSLRTVNASRSSSRQVQSDWESSSNLNARSSQDRSAISRKSTSNSQVQARSSQSRNSNARVSQSSSSKSINSKSRNSQVRQSKAKPSSGTISRSTMSERSKSNKSGGESSSIRKTGSSKSKERNKRR